jgi:hypothetical protein
MAVLIDIDIVLFLQLVLFAHFMLLLLILDPPLLTHIMFVLFF